MWRCLPTIGERNCTGYIKWVFRLSSHLRSIPKLKCFVTLVFFCTSSLVFGQESCCALMDFNGDRTVSISDFTIFLSVFGTEGMSPEPEDCAVCYSNELFDADLQGDIGLSDLLVMLSLFGATDIDEDLIWDGADPCFDLNSCNYMDHSAVECFFLDLLGVCGGPCVTDSDNDGLCDNLDGCIDVFACNYVGDAPCGCSYFDDLGFCSGINDLDGDGVCNDNDGCSDIEACNFLELAPCGCVYMDSTGLCTGINDIDGDGICNAEDECDGTDPAQWCCGASLSYQGHSYSTTLIGDQCWFSENLRSEFYSNGDTSDVDWPMGFYGRFYDFYSVKDERGVCPSGWHVPNDLEWIELEMELGMSEEDAFSSGPRGTNEANQMKTSEGWWDCWDGTPDGGINSSGFSALPGGFYYSLSPSGGGRRSWKWIGWRLVEFFTECNQPFSGMVSVYLLLQ